MMGISGRIHGKSASWYSRLSGGGGDGDVEKEEKSAGGGGRIRKGYIPMVVGQTEEETERILVPTKLLKHPCIISLLDLSASELGYTQPGNLRIHYDVQQFKRMLRTIL
nr:Small auxin-up RNA [Ipomoea batatas]